MNMGRVMILAGSLEMTGYMPNGGFRLVRRERLFKVLMEVYVP